MFRLRMIRNAAEPRRNKWRLIFCEEQSYAWYVRCGGTSPNTGTALSLQALTNTPTRVFFSVSKRVAYSGCNHAKNTWKIQYIYACMCATDRNSASNYEYWYRPMSIGRTNVRRFSSTYCRCNLNRRQQDPRDFNYKRTSTTEEKSCTFLFTRACANIYVRACSWWQKLGATCHVNVCGSRAPHRSLTRFFRTWIFYWEALENIWPIFSTTSRLKWWAQYNQSKIHAR